MVIKVIRVKCWLFFNKRNDSSIWTLWNYMTKSSTFKALFWCSVGSTLSVNSMLLHWLWRNGLAIQWRLRSWETPLDRDHLFANGPMSTFLFYSCFFTWIVNLQTSSKVQYGNNWMMLLISIWRPLRFLVIVCSSNFMTSHFIIRCSNSIVYCSIDKSYCLKLWNW